MVGFVFRAALSVIGLWIATRWVSGIRIDDPRTLLLAGVVLGVVNAIVRPIAVRLTFPLTILTLGLFLLVVNGLMVWLVSALLSGFKVSGLVAAIGTSLVVWVTGCVASWFIKS